MGLESIQKKAGGKHRIRGTKRWGELNISNPTLSPSKINHSELGWEISTRPLVKKSPVILALASHPTAEKNRSLKVFVTLHIL